MQGEDIHSTNKLIYGDLLGILTGCISHSEVNARLKTE
jgi:hypothetical protein